MSKKDDFWVGDKVTRAGINGVVAEIRTELPYTHQIKWENGREDWYSDKPFRNNEIVKLSSSQDTQSTRGETHSQDPRPDKSATTSDEELKKELKIEWLWLTHTLSTEESVDRSLNKTIEIIREHDALTVEGAIMTNTKDPQPDNSDSKEGGMNSHDTEELELTRKLDALQSKIWARCVTELEKEGVKLSVGQSYGVGSVIKEVLHPEIQNHITQHYVDREGLIEALPEDRPGLQVFTDCEAGEYMTCTNCGGYDECDCEGFNEAMAEVRTLIATYQPKREETE